MCSNNHNSLKPVEIIINMLGGEAISTAPRIMFFDFEQGYQPWVLDQGTYPLSTDFGNGIGLPSASTNSTSWVYRRLAYINISSLGFTPKLLGFFYTLSTVPGHWYSYTSYAKVAVRYYDSTGNLLKEDTVVSGSTSTSATWKGGYVGTIPDNTAMVEILIAHRINSSSDSSIVSGWFDNVVFAEDGSISIHATPVLFYNVTASYDIPINKTLSASTKAVFVRIVDYSPPSNTSVTPTLYYDSSTASPSTTSVLTINSSIPKMNYSGSSNANNEQQFSVDAYAIYIVQPPNTFIDLIVIRLNVNTSPQKPELVSFPIPSPASNYTTSYTASLKIQHSTTPSLNTQVSFSLSISGDATNITYAKVGITVKDPSGNVVYDDYFEVQNGNITRTPAALSILPNVTYSLIYTVNITASPTQQTVISVSVQYTTRPQVS
jgi:hypothetical protein